MNATLLLWASEIRGEASSTRDLATLGNASTLEQSDQSASGATTEDVLPESSSEGHRLPPRVAIIIDDMGYHRQLGGRFIDLPLHLSYSFLPDTPFAATQATRAHKRGRDVLVHLPMEPKDSKWNLGEDALYMRDSHDILREKTRKMLDSIPHAVGANNHMGSRFTEDAAAMRTTLEILGARSFFFIDSITTPGTQGLKTARQLSIPSERRRIFLDNVQEVNAICRQMEMLGRIAEKEGQAIAIGHPYQATLDALNRCGDRLLKKAKLVGVHELVR